MFLAVSRITHKVELNARMDLPFPIAVFLVRRPTVIKDLDLDLTAAGLIPVVHPGPRSVAVPR